MLRLLHMSAWPMPLYEPYGFFHLGVMTVGIALASICALLCSNLAAHKRDAVLYGVGCFLALSECYKQLFLTFVINTGRYGWWHFPFQLCSVPLYFCLMLRRVRGVAHDIILEFLATYTLIGALGAFIDPSGMLYRFWTLTLHSFIWHILLVFIGLLAGLTALPNRKSRLFAHAAVLYLCLAAMALTLNFALYERARGDINLFYLGPNRSGQIFFSFIYDHLGWQANALAYCAVCTLAAYLAHTLFSRRTVTCRHTTAPTAEKD